nr:carboxypeptidase-like regulatory domain-containing protein [Bryobacter sp.]
MNRFTRLVALSLLLAAAAAAQSNFGSIRGAVTDSTGAVIPNAKVIVTNAGTNAQITLATNDQGQYVAAALQPVTYSVSVEAPGFQKKTVTDVKVDTASIATVDVVLQPGAVQQEVTVSGDVPLVQTYSGAVQQNVDQRTINELPLNGRNTLELAMTLPGVGGSPGTEISELTTNEPVPGRELAVNGGRVGSTQFQADGANVTSVALARMAISFSPDTIQEFSVQQANYSAQFAQAGGAIIQQTTKSGSNEFHGTGFWFHRQKAFTATPFDSQRSPVTNFDNRPPLRRQQLGAVVTGPVWLPKVYNGKNRTFFMASYEPTRQLASNPGGPTFSRVPTEREINGDFSQSLVYFRSGNTVRAEPYALLYNQFIRRSDGALALRPNPAFNPALPASATNFTYQYRNFPLFNPNDADPTRRGRVLVDETGRSLVNPVSQRMLREMYPRPNITDPGIIADLLGANYSYFRTTNYEDDRYTVKIDHNVTDNHRLSGRWTEQPQFGNRAFRDVIQHGLVSDANKSRQILVALTSAPRPTMTNEFRANYVHGNFGRNFPEPLLGKDWTNDFLNIGGAGAGAMNLLGYG